MSVAVQVTYRGMKTSEALTQLVEEGARNLTRFDRRLTACHAVVERKGSSDHSPDVYFGVESCAWAICAVK